VVNNPLLLLQLLRELIILIVNIRSHLLLLWDLNHLSVLRLLLTIYYVWQHGDTLVLLLLLKVIVKHLRQSKHTVASLIRLLLLLLLRPFIFIVHGFSTWRLLRKRTLCLNYAKIRLVVCLPRKLFDLMMILGEPSSRYRNRGSQ